MMDLTNVQCSLRSTARFHPFIDSRFTVRMGVWWVRSVFTIVFAFFLENLYVKYESVSRNGRAYTR